MELNKQRMMKLAGLLTESMEGGIEANYVNFGKDPKKFAKGYSGSTTVWKDTTMLSKKDAMNIMKQALPNGYNEFKAELIDKLPADSKIQIAREYSVCLYVKTNTKLSKASLKADELDNIGNGVYRVWWD
jgi:hypothetical protein